MEKIYRFGIRDADAAFDGKGLRLKLVYPRNIDIDYTPPRKYNKTTLEFGIDRMEQLIEGGSVTLAREDIPFTPPSSGCIYIFNDGYFVTPRRDKEAEFNPLCHSVYSGFPQSMKDLVSVDGIVNNALREAAEECLLITNEDSPWLIVPNDSKEYTLKTAERLGIRLKPRYVDVGIEHGEDVLEVYDEDGSQILHLNAILNFTWYPCTALNVVFIRRFPFSHEEVLPVDAEGDYENGRFVHFNRESYVLDSSDIKYKWFGDILGNGLRNPIVYQTRIERGKPIPYEPQYERPYFGPEGKEVIHPHIWAPDNQLPSALEALGIWGDKGRWMELEIWKQKRKLKGRDLLPRYACC